MKILHKPLQQKRAEIWECIDPVFVTDVVGRKFESIAYIRILPLWPLLQGGISFLYVSCFFLLHDSPGKSAMTS